MNDTLKITLLFIAILFIAGYVIAAEHVRAVLRKPASTDDDASPITAAPWKGKASYYGEGYRGKRMANGNRFDPDALTCAAWEWPLGTALLVTHRNCTVRVIVTDRGPATKFEDRVVDLSQNAFTCLAPLRVGVIPVSVVVDPFFHRAETQTGK